VHLPSLLPSQISLLYPLFPTLLHHHLLTDITPFLMPLLNTALSCTYDTPTRIRLLKHVPQDVTVDAIPTLLNATQLPADIATFLLLFLHPHLPHIPSPATPILCRLQASSHASPAALYGRCGQVDGGICLPGLLTNSSVSLSTSQVNDPTSANAISRHFSFYLTSYLQKRGHLVQPVIISEATCFVFVDAITRCLSEGLPCVDDSRALTLLQNCVSLPSFHTLPTSLKTRLASYSSSFPITKALTTLLDSPSFKTTSPAFKSLLSWSYILLHCPKNQNPLACVRLQNLLLHHILPSMVMTDDNVPTLAAIDVILRAASSLGSIDAGLMLVEIGAIGPYTDDSRAFAAKAGILNFLLAHPNLYSGKTYKPAEIEAVAAALSTNRAQELLGSEDLASRDVGLAVLWRGVMGGDVTEVDLDEGVGDWDRRGKWGAFVKSLR
jgi:hypothetical protein